MQSGRCAVACTLFAICRLEHCPANGQHVSPDPTSAGRHPNQSAGAMVATTNRLTRRLSLLLAAMGLALPCLLLAAQPDVELKDAQTLCAAPAQQFSARLTEAGTTAAVDESLREQFLAHLEQCRAVYRYHLAQVGRDFQDLPAGAYCHSVREDFIEAEYLFDVASLRAAALPLGSEEEREEAVAFLQDANGALVRAVNGVFLLRHGICMEERIAPFARPPFESEINRTYPHIE
tara:strand:+ start:2090 stop:2791 length:702 start_codon:yes stop_codon:yes gene_type:complete